MRTLRRDGTAAQAVNRRRGYTLVEMLIVCAVLAALAGMSWPAMRGMLSKARLQEAADELRTTLRKARIEAVRSGTVTVVQYEPGGRRYRVGDWEAILLAMENGGFEGAVEFTAVEESAEADDSELSAPRLVEHKLPVGVRFDPEEDGGLDLGLETETAVETESLDLTGTGVAPTWGELIVFRSNGRSDDAEIRLIDERRFLIDVELRGLTGTVAATAPRRLDPAVVEEPVLPTEELGGTP